VLFVFISIVVWFDTSVWKANTISASPGSSAMDSPKARCTHSPNKQCREHRRVDSGLEELDRDNNAAVRYLARRLSESTIM
jgi:hypothetical protein